MTGFNKRTGVWRCDDCNDIIPDKIIFQPSFYGEKEHKCNVPEKERRRL